MPSLKNKIGPSVTSYFARAFFLFLLLSSSCVQENDVPVYINIPSFSFTTTTGQGTAAQKISDVWVYVDGLSLGAYQLPARFPFVGTGKHEFLLFAGIRNNGIRSNPVRFELAKTFSTTLDLKTGDDITIRPTTTYIDGVKIWLNEDFERTNTFNVNKDNNLNTAFATVSDGFEGNGAAILLSKANPTIEKATTIKAQLPDNAQSSIIELHYKTDSPLSVGILGTSSSFLNGDIAYKVVLSPNQTWNKTYIDVTQEAKNLKAKDFQVIFRSLLPDSLDKARILIDNVKLIQK
jgi:hypothetical protein